MSKLFIGTCSWANKELVDSGLFYPADVRRLKLGYGTTRLTLASYQERLKS